MAAAAPPTPAIMEEVLATDLVEGEEYYYHEMHKVPRNTASGVFQTFSKDIVRFNGFQANNTIGDFTRVQRIYGRVNTLMEDKLMPNGNFSLHLNLPEDDFWNESFRFKLYRKTDTPMKERKRTDLQRREALAQMYDTGYRYYKDDGTLVEKPGLNMAQYVDNDGVPQFGHAPPLEGEHAGQNDPTYLPGGKRKSRRTRKSKKSRKGKSRKNRRKSNRRRR